MIVGKYLVIRPKDSTLAVGAEGNSDAENCRVVLCDFVKREKHQVWYHDVSSSTIRCRANDMCLTKTRDGTLKLTAYGPDKQDAQAMMIDKNTIRMKNDMSKAVKVQTKSRGSTLMLGPHTDDETHWAIKNIEIKLFYLEANNGLVLTTDKNSTSPKTPLVLAKKKLRESDFEQLWYEDKNANLRCVHNHHVLDASQNELVLDQDEDKPEKKWVLNGNTVSLRNDNSMMLTVLDPGMGVDTRVGVLKNSDSVHQKWTRVHLN